MKQGVQLNYQQSTPRNSTALNSLVFPYFAAEYTCRAQKPSIVKNTIDDIANPYYIAS